MKAMKAMKAMKSMKAMKAMSSMKTKHGALSASGAYSAVAETVGLKPKQVKEVAEAMMAVAAKQLKLAGSFKIAGAVIMKEKSARHTKRGVNGRFTKEPCVFTVEAMKQFKDMVK